MKKLFLIGLGIVVAVAGAWTWGNVERTAAAGVNLIANASVETAASATQPQNWKVNAWGANTTTSSYPQTGHTGTRSVRVDMTAFTGGDAKWFFDPVSVIPNKTYTFSDYYQSNTTTEVVVQYTHESGAVSYAWLGSPVASSSWKQSSYTFTAPATARKATVFHLISRVGWFVIDDADLRETDPPTTGTNVAPNASLETVVANDATRPDKWVTDKWGTNTASLTYPQEGRTGARSVRTQITSYTDGDAKWYFEPVTVQPNTKYDFSDYYRSNVETQVIARYTHENGTVSYAWLGNVPGSSSWQRAAFSLTTPVTARSATILHIVNSVGWLQIDDISFAAMPFQNPIPNPSLEQAADATGLTPKDWIKNSWGTNKTVFSYPTDGHVGSRSVKLTVSDYVNGDAKWYFKPQPLESGKAYRFSVWYKTNVTPRITTMYTKANGSIDYHTMPIAQVNGSTTAWQFYTDTFVVPKDTQSTSTFMYLDQNGWLQTDNYSIEPYQPIGFDRPLVSLTFDDGFEENETTVLPALNAKGMKSTQCFATKYIEGVPGADKQIRSFYNAGHEICSHTVSHPFLTSLTETQRTYELAHSRDYLQSVTGSPVRNFASPYGDYNATVKQAVSAYYRSHRTVNDGYNSKDNFDTYGIRVQNLLSTTTLAEYQSWLDYAKKSNTWLVLVYHKVTSGTGVAEFDTRTADFNKQIDALQASGLTVKTYNAAFDELLLQL